MLRAEPAIRPIAMLGLVLCIAAFWMIQHPYERIVHDSILYCFSALARLYPQSLGRDIYLTVGVQDRFTVFSPIAASVIRAFGLERGASLITFLAQIAFYICGWLLARRFMSATYAILALALLVMLPPIYGDRHIFSYAEGFMTPRLPSEVFVLCALTAWLGRQHVLGALCLTAAVLLHPIMAEAGFVLLFMLLVGLPKPRIALAIVGGSMIAIAAVAYMTPFGPIAIFDAGWFHLLYSRGGYLFPSRWGLVDWAHASIPLSVLAAGWCSTEEPRVRSVCAAALLTGLAGLVISLIGSDLLRIVVITQAQPWRWLWLCNALAVLVTPLVLRGCWRGQGVSRSAAVLLAAAWVCIDEPYAPAIGIFAILLAGFGGHVLDRRSAKAILFGACAVLVLGFLALAQFVYGVVKDVALIPPDNVLYDSRYLLELRVLKPWQAGGVVPALIFLAGWWTATHRKDMPSALAVLTLGMGLCGAFGQFSWNAWINWPRAQIPKALYAEFAPWRQAIPQSATVLWGDFSFPTWYLLHRASYWSRDQMAASVFSEPLARELARREYVILGLERATSKPRRALSRICRNDPVLGYIVSPVNAGPTPYPQLSDVGGKGFVRLYRCADFKG